MKNHSKDPDYKEYLALCKKRDKLWSDKWRNKIKLDEPYHRGFNHCLEPRQDIQNRQDAWIFWAICECFVEESYSRKKEPSEKEKRNKWFSGTEYTPSIRRISVEEYDTYVPAIQKHFRAVDWEFVSVEDNSFIHVSSNGEHCWRGGRGKVKTWVANNKGYVCNLPSFYFVKKTEKNLVEYCYEIDEILEQELSEIDDKISTKFRRFYSWNFRKQDRKMTHKKVKTHNKRVMKRVTDLIDPQDAYGVHEEFIESNEDLRWLY